MSEPKTGQQIPETIEGPLTVEHGVCVSHVPEGASVTIWPKGYAPEQHIASPESDGAAGLLRELRQAHKCFVAGLNTQLDFNSAVAQICDKSNELPTPTPSPPTPPEEIELCKQLYGNAFVYDGQLLDPAKVQIHTATPPTEGEAEGPLYKVFGGTAAENYQFTIALRNERGSYETVAKQVEMDVEKRIPQELYAEFFERFINELAAQNPSRGSDGLREAAKKIRLIAAGLGGAKTADLEDARAYAESAAADLQNLAAHLDQPSEGFDAAEKFAGAKFPTIRSDDE